jgi:hypothetical protein
MKVVVIFVVALSRNRKVDFYVKQPRVNHVKQTSVEENLGTDVEAPVV